MRKHVFGLLALIMVLSMVLVAAQCGGGGGGGKSTVPVYTNAKPDTAGKYETVRKALEDSQKPAVAGKGYPNFEAKAYITNDTVDPVVAFYKDALKSWTFATEQTSGPVTTVAWAKGDSEGFVIAYVPDQTGGQDHALITIQYWK
jgi:hypothetical protein